MINQRAIPVGQTCDFANFEILGPLFHLGTVHKHLTAPRLPVTRVAPAAGPDLLPVRSSFFLNRQWLSPRAARAPQVFVLLYVLTPKVIHQLAVVGTRISTTSFFKSTAARLLITSRRRQSADSVGDKVDGDRSAISSACRQKTARRSYTAGRTLSVQHNNQRVFLHLDSVHTNCYFQFTDQRSGPRRHARVPRYRHSKDSFTDTHETSSRMTNFFPIHRVTQATDRLP